MRTFPSLGYAVDHEEFTEATLNTLRSLVLSGALAFCDSSRLSELEDEISLSAEITRDRSLSIHGIFCASCAMMAANSYHNPILFANSIDMVARSAGAARELSRKVYSGDSPEYKELRNTSSAARAAVFAATTLDTEVKLGWPALWESGSMPDGLKRGWQYLRQRLEKDNDNWGFWIDWYENCLQGTPIDWNLIYKLAREISAQDWNEGEKRVADRVREISALFQLEERIAELERVIEVHNTRHGIGGNSPPPGMRIEPEIFREMTVIWGAVDELKLETKSEFPDKAAVLQSIEKLNHALKAILAWGAQKGDLSIDTLIKWGIPLGGAAILADPKLVTAIIEAAKNWVSFLP